jgi:hypothetical protein
VNESSKKAAVKSRWFSRLKSVAGDIDVAGRVSIDKLSRGPNTTTLLFFRLTPIIMAMHNRLCKRILPIFAD